MRELNHTLPTQIRSKPISTNSETWPQHPVTKRSPVFPSTRGTNLNCTIIRKPHPFTLNNYIFKTPNTIRCKPTYCNFSCYCSKPLPNKYPEPTSVNWWGRRSDELSTRGPWVWYKKPTKRFLGYELILQADLGCCKIQLLWSIVHLNFFQWESFEQFVSSE